MLQKLKNFFTLKRSLIIFVIIFSLYSITVGLIVPWYAKSKLIPEQFAKFQLEASVEELSYNPYRQRLTMKNFSAKHQGTEYIGFKEFMININVTDIILGKGLIFDAFLLDNPRLYAERDKEGELNLIKIIPKDLLQKKETEAPKESDEAFVLPTIEFNSFAVSNGSIAVKDLTNEKPFEWELNDLSFALPQFSTKQELENQPALKLISNTGMSLEFKGALQFTPLSTKGTVKLENFDLTPFSPYYEPKLHLDLKSGKLGFEVEYEIDTLASDPKLGFNVKEFTIEDFVLNEIEDQETIQSLPFFQIRNLSCDLLKSTIILDELEIKDGFITIERDKTGQINVLPPITEEGSKAVVEEKEPAPFTKGSLLTKVGQESETVLEKPAFSNDLFGAIQSLTWHLEKIWAQSWISIANDVHIHNYTITLEDEMIPGGTTVAVNDLYVRINDLKNKEGEEAKLAVSFMINETEQKLNAQFSPIPLKGNFETDFQNLPLNQLNPYIKEYSPYDLQKILLSFKSKTEFDIPFTPEQAITVKGDSLLGISQLLLKEQNDKQILELDELKTQSKFTVVKAKEISLDANNSVKLTGFKAQDNTLKASTQVQNIELNNSSSVKLFEDNKIQVSTQNEIQLKDLAAKEENQKLQLIVSLFKLNNSADIKVNTDKNIELDSKSSIKVNELNAKHGLQNLSANFKELNVDNSAGLKLGSNKEIDLSAKTWLKLNELNAKHETQGLSSQFKELTVDNSADLELKDKMTLKGEVSLKLNELAAQAKNPEAQFSLKSFEGKKIAYDLEPMAVKISEMIITEASASLVRELQEQATSSTSDTESQKPAEKEEAKALIEVFQIAELIPLDLQIDSLKILDNKAELKDKTFIHDWQFIIDDIDFEVKNFKSRGQDPVDMKMTADVQDFGQLSLDAVFPFNNSSLDGHFNYALKTFPLKSTSPLAVTFTHYPITKGSLEVEVLTKIEDNKLEGTVGAIIKKIKLGSKEEADGRAMNIPLKFGISLLQNSKGVIDFSGIPIHGELTDPQFRIWSVAWRTLKSICVKAVTSPFGYFANLVGGDEDELEFITFRDGSDKLSQDLEEQLTKVVEGLEKRPELALTLIERGLSPKDIKLLKAEKLKSQIESFQTQDQKFNDLDLSKIQQLYYSTFPEAFAKDTAVTESKSKEPVLIAERVLKETTEEAPKEESRTSKRMIRFGKSHRIRSYKKSSSTKSQSESSSEWAWYKPWTWGKTEKKEDSKTALIVYDKGDNPSQTEATAVITYISDEEATKVLLRKVELSEEEKLELRKQRLTKMLELLDKNKTGRIKIKEKLNDTADSHFRITIEQ